MRWRRGASLPTSRPPRPWSQPTIRFGDSNVQTYEFQAALQRLALIGTMLEKTDVDGLVDYLQYADSLAPIMGTNEEGQARIDHLRRYVAKAQEFRGECIRLHNELSEAGRIVATSRRAALNPAPDA